MSQSKHFRSSVVYPFCASFDDPNPMDGFRQQNTESLDGQRTRHRGALEPAAPSPKIPQGIGQGPVP